MNDNAKEGLARVSSKESNTQKQGKDKMPAEIKLGVVTSASGNPTMSGGINENTKPGFVKGK